MKSKPFFSTLIFTIYFFYNSDGQNSIIVPKNEYNLQIVDNKRLYNGLVAYDSSLYLVSLTDCISGVILDLRYSTNRNFMNHPMYPKNTKMTYLRLPAAFALKMVEDELALKKMHLKIFDAYRPYSVTIKFWKAIQDERYVANPAKGSGHNKGLAVDLTIVDSTGKELDMGTDFDNFTDTAYHEFANLPSKVLENRKMLKSIMAKHGFKPLDSEWWHYIFDFKEFSPLYSLSFKCLIKKHL